MARIKKQGLDYFPLTIDFVQNRTVRRVMKREGDAAAGVLIALFSAIYGGRGYYIEAGLDLYEDLSDLFYHLEPADVERVVRVALETGMFSADLFSSYAILTSEEVQKQFLYCTRGRSRLQLIDPRYLLIAETETTTAAAPASQPTAASQSVASPEATSEAKPETASLSPQNAENAYQNAQKATESTQSIAQHSIAQQSKENLLLSSSPQSGGTDAAARAAGGEAYAVRKGNLMELSALPGEGRPLPQGGGQMLRSGSQPLPQGAGQMPQSGSQPLQPDKAAHPKAARLTQADIDRLTAPNDGVPRNLNGLRYNLHQFNVPLNEQYAIILKSNYGMIGHPMWKGFEPLRSSRSTIHFPGRFLLSLCR